MMSCEEMTGIIGDYLDGKIPFGKKFGIMMHFAICRHCRRYFQQIQQVIDLSREAGAEEAPMPAPEPMKRNLLAAFRAAHAKEGEGQDTLT